MNKHLLGVGTVLVLGAAILSPTMVGASSKPDAVPIEVKELQETLPEASLLREFEREKGYIHREFSLDEDLIGARRRPENAVVSESVKDRFDVHAESRMREGKNLDVASLEVVDFQVPEVAPFFLIVDSGAPIEQLTVEVDSETSNAKGRVSETGRLNEAVGVLLAVGEGNPQVADVSAGFNGAVNHANMRRRGHGSATIFWNPYYNSPVDHWVTTNWEKWQSTRQHNEWAYNRWATFDAANGGSAGWGMTWRGDMIDATIRSRPMSGSEYKVTGGPWDYEPRPSQYCQTYTSSINVGTLGSLKIPSTNCYSGQEIYPNGNQHSMGTAWYGRTTAQRYLDFAFSFTAKNWQTPYMADYVYMKVQYCKGYTSAPCGYWNPTQSMLWTDGGW